MHKIRGPVANCIKMRIAFEQRELHSRATHPCLAACNEWPYYWHHPPVLFDNVIAKPTTPEVQVLHVLWSCVDKQVWTQSEDNKQLSALTVQILCFPQVHTEWMCL